MFFTVLDIVLLPSMHQKNIIFGGKLITIFSTILGFPY